MILEIPESSGTEDINRALRRIRARYHPDKNNSSEASRRLVQLAEEAHRSLLSKQMVSSALEPLIGKSRLDIFGNMLLHPSSQMNASGLDARINELINNPDLNGRRVHESSYSYSNINGNVNESGRINGRSMNQSELNQYRPHNRRFYISDIS